MWNTPTKYQLNQIPGLYQTENLSEKDKMIYLHFFIGGCDWYVAEYDADEDLFFGFTILNEDYDCAEWGYVSFQELKQLRIKPFGIEIDCERGDGWKPRKASEIKKIVEAQRW